MSRMAVLYVFPFFMIPVCLIKGCLVFKRGHIKDKVAFNNWIDRCMDSSPQDGLLIYPEGEDYVLMYLLMHLLIYPEGEDHVLMYPRR